MIGSAKLSYTNENVCELVRKDLVDKFGNRELANYNLYLPGVIRPKAVVTRFPDPEVKITTVAEQMKELNLPEKPKVRRVPDSITVERSLYGSDLQSTYDSKTGKLVVDGTLAFVSGEDTEPEELYSGHWFMVKVGVPVDVDLDDLDYVGYSVNGEPRVYEVTGDEDGFISIQLDGAYTTLDLLISWNPIIYQAEPVYVRCVAQLTSQAVSKIPEFPTQPKFMFEYPDCVVDATVQVDVDLDLGKQ